MCTADLSPFGVLVDEGLDDSEELLLFFAGQGGNGRQLSFELRLRPAFLLPWPLPVKGYWMGIVG